MATITEIAPDVYRVSLLNKQLGLQFNHFVVKDEEPLLYHTGYRSSFAELREAVAQVIDPVKLRWIGWSHFESDECGSLNEWLQVAPTALPACGFLSAALNANDFSNRPPRVMNHGDVLSTGKYRFRFVATAQLPHGWDAGVMFEETNRTLLCSDLFTHFGDVEPITETDIVGRARETLQNMQDSPFAYYIPYTAQTRRVCHQLANLQPKTLATMHGSSFIGDCSQALRDLDIVLKEVLDK
jgi:flavorubredoxin